MSTAPTAQQVADVFVAQLKDALKPWEWEEMLKLNAAETSALVCHSHDHCDANTIMFDVLESLNVTCFVDDQMPQEVCDLWNAAWELAGPALGKTDPTKFLHVAR